MVSWSLLSLLPGCWPPAQRPSSRYFPFPVIFSWKEAVQPAFNPTEFFESIDFNNIEGGISPLDTTETVAVPDFSGVESLAELSATDRELFDAFVRHVARDSLFALQDVVVDGETVVRAGDLLIVAKGGFPNTLRQVQNLRAAGHEQVRAMVNLIHAVLWPRDPQRRFETLLRSPTIYERQLNNRQKRDNLERMIDNNPVTAFERIDRPNRPVEKRAVVILVDIVSRFPVGLIRFYPRPVENPIAIAAYSLEVNDGITVRRGQDVEVSQLRVGSNYLNLGANVTVTEGGIPVYNIMQLNQSNTVDTVSIELDPPEYQQRYKFRSLTGLNYDIAEFEAYNQGFPPVAIYLTRPLPVDKSALETQLAFLNFEDVADQQSQFIGLRRDLDRLEGGTLGRIFWEEEKVGDPGKSRAVVGFQTGLTPEPWVYIRLNANGDEVEWRPNAEVVDRREESTTFNQLVNLDDANLRASARDIWNALSDQERASVQTSFAEYSDPRLVAAANKQTRQGSIPLPILPDPIFWSGFQPVTNGQLIPLPGERPFFQLRVDFSSENPQAATVIKNLRFEQLLPPILPGVRAEIVPATGVEAGLDTLFTYALRPQIEPGDAGFNRLRVATPTSIRGIEKVEFGYGDLQGLARREEVNFERVEVTESYFVLGLPRIDATQAADDSLVVMVQFRGRVLDVKTSFTGHVFLDTLGEGPRDYSDIISVGAGENTVSILPQRVQEGDVLDFSEAMGDRNTLNVVTTVAQNIQDVIMRVELTPNPFTPNGDGVNDELKIAYDVLRVFESVPVRTEVYDLSGRLVWKPPPALRKVGEVRESWDGRNDEGSLLPPGMYLMKISAETDAEDFTSTQLISLVY